VVNLGDPSGYKLIYFHDMGTVRSFMFHDVRNLEDTEFPRRYTLKSFLSKKQFEYQLDWINKNYEIVSTEELLYLDLNRSKKNYATLTFDDGLSDHFYVYQILKSKRLKGSFFVPARPIVEEKVMYSHKIQFILAKVGEKIIVDKILSDFGDDGSIWNKYSQTKWKNNWWSKEMIFVTNFLRMYENFDYLDSLFEKLITQDEEGFSKDLYLTVEQIEEMSNNGMIIGGHGYVSENLLSLPDPFLDLKKSKDFVSRFSDKFYFSYPNGGYNDSIKSFMGEIDCILSYTVNQMTLTELDVVDFLDMPRYDSPQKVPLP
jgi:peptidoglycan/xylan/chitin deacetylase (PgdA/CDA1 family)